MTPGQIHHTFGKPSAEGLADYLAGQASLDDIIQPTGIDNYWLITHGTAPPNPSELLMHQRFANTMQQLGERFDLVVIDTPLSWS